VSNPKEPSFHVSGKLLLGRLIFFSTTLSLTLAPLLNDFFTARKEISFLLTNFRTK
jgi:hypothetical protein